ncbi:hypothetical protein [Myxococcus sp. SDU36]|uniref:hypothetical protein n=1 Tax=Myxococcus sp. SDU36 TaxID=2831967 RepID=UPI0025426D23|nr:hypothetical protein [Myxococcus sp. SDU36]WIG96742.1 hypothetical protein KGD87_04750 [Myxococcus sp. SDU36]
MTNTKENEISLIPFTANSFQAQCIKGGKPKKHLLPELPKMMKPLLRATLGFSALALAQSAQAIQAIEDRLELDDGSAIFYPTPVVAQQAQLEMNYEINPNCYGYCYGGTEAGDPDAIGFKDEGNTPDASNTTEPAGTQSNPSTTVVPVFTKNFVKEVGFGNNTFGTGYTLSATLTAFPTTGTTTGQFQAVGEGKVWARVFNIRHDVLRGKATGVVPQSGPVFGLVEVFDYQGRLTYQKQFGTVGPVNDAPKFTRKYFEAEKSITVMGYPVKLKAAVTGETGIAVTGELGLSTVKLTTTPSAKLYATASAGVDFVVASLSVDGTLTLIEAQLPVNTQIVASSCSTLNWKLTADATIKALAGDIKVKLKIKLLFIKIRGTVTIARWSGQSRTQNLFTATAQNPITLACANGVPVGGIGTISGGTTTGGGGSTGGGGTGGGGGGGGGVGCVVQDTTDTSVRHIPTCDGLASLAM